MDVGIGHNFLFAEKVRDLGGKSDVSFPSPARLVCPSIWPINVNGALLPPTLRHERRIDSPLSEKWVQRSCRGSLARRSGFGAEIPL